MTKDLFGNTPAPDVELDDGEYLLAHHDTSPSGLAILCSEYGDRHETFWLPLSQVTFLETGKHISMHVGAEKFTEIKVRIPEWLAKEKGLT